MVQNSWPFNNEINESSTARNQKMVGKLITRKKVLEELDPKTLKWMATCGRRVEQNRERQHLTRLQASTIMGLDHGFMCILENGDALPEEIGMVVDRLFKCDLL